MSDDAYPAARSRPIKMAGGDSNGSPSPYPPSFSSRAAPPPPTTTTRRTSSRNPPPLPTPTERLVLLLYPALLAFGTLFSLVSPETRAAPYDAARHAHVQDSPAVPSYFARKDNLLNLLFVKRGWAWITVAFAAFVLSHPAFRSVPVGNSSGGSGGKTFRAAARWALVTTWWILVTQWCFGPPIIDRGFRFTGGRCEVALAAVSSSSSSSSDSVSAGADTKDVFTAAACRAAGGRWSGGHDISGHVFLLVLGSFFLLQEIGWVVLRAGILSALDGARSRVRHEERCVVMSDGAVKGASVEALTEDTTSTSYNKDVAKDGDPAALGLGGRFAMAVVALCLWMLLMTAIYFHTWFEKFTGLLTAAAGIYVVYYVPRFVPSIRAIVGLPGI
ncbi:hypothetical protein MGN70_011532 [Eutypa lata]|nr:hypothetical protein MGN70_011532 [Eutypa lata]